MRSKVGTAFKRIDIFIMTNNNNQSLEELKSKLGELERKSKELGEKFFNSWIKEKKIEFEKELNKFSENSNKLNEMFKNLFMIQIRDQKKVRLRLFRRKGDHKSITETKIFKDKVLGLRNFSENEKNEIEKLYQKYFEVVELEEESKKKSDIDNKIEIFKKILDSQLELENEKIKELEEGIDKLKEESLQREIEIIEKAISLLKEKENSGLSDLLNRSKERVIIRKTGEYLEAKNSYLNIRLKIAKELDEFCKKLSKDNISHQKGKIVIKGISDLLGTLSLSVKPMGIGFNINLGKLGEVISDVNDYLEINLQSENSEEFNKCLESDEKDGFEKVYYSLLKELNENEKLEIRKEIVSSLKLELDVNSGVLKEFKTRYEKICSIVNNWKGGYSSPDEMKKKVESIVKDLSELDIELTNENSSFRAISLKNWIQQINDLKWYLEVDGKREEWEKELRGKVSILEIREYAKETLRDIYQVANKKVPSDLWKLESYQELLPKK